jgi:hypothetical protein
LQGVVEAVVGLLEIQEVKVDKVEGVTGLGLVLLGKQESQTRAAVAAVVVTARSFQLVALASSS